MFALISIFLSTFSQDGGNMPGTSYIYLYIYEIHSFFLGKYSKIPSRIAKIPVSVYLLDE